VPSPQRLRRFPTGMPRPRREAATVAATNQLEVQPATTLTTPASRLQVTAGGSRVENEAF